MRHARPHLQTHGRSQGHSAVAGAAYRLGLRLYDERTKTWHDFRRRKLGEEIVAALTLAPEGAPDWATDPGQLWNRAEAAELRKDSQVARDYRIPVPFGLSDEQATDMATQMAQFIVDQLHTAVSLGLHRDADVDALGAVKPKEKQGYHAHIYIPTRRLEQLEQAEGDGTSKSDWGLHTKFAFLTGRRSSSDFVERLNARWAELANEFTAANELPADYTHLSYARQGLPFVPQPTLGQAVVAMERKGFFTRKGNAVRDIVVPSEIHKVANGAAMDAQHQQAVADLAREMGKLVRPNEASKPLVTPGRQAESSRDEQADGPPTAPSPLPKPPMTALAGSLVARFHAAAPAPTTPEERRLFIRVLKIAAVVERVLAALNDLAHRFRKHAEDLGRRMAAKLDTDYQLDGCRAQRASAKEKLEQWEANHRWQVVTARAFGADGIKPKAWQSLIGTFEACQRRVQTMKATLRSHQVYLDNFADDEAQLRVQQADTRQRLRAALGTMVALDQGSVEPLLSVTSGVELEWLRAHLPDMGTTMDGVPQGSEPSEAVARLRPVGRRVVGAP
ncbi:MobA/MobL family protein [Dyella sp. S184]|uniref:MobA/MobL family protein n=1 Tax=Dyella sp. S184 TaxID=1641862 RepID=UPI00131D2B6B|nr:MobA/MobL family protein [Dyella sp. S184]